MIIMGSLIISNFFPETLVVFSFLGAFCAVFSYLLPVLLEVVSNRHKWNYVGNVTQVLIAVLLTLVAFTSAFLSLVLPNT